MISWYKPHFWGREEQYVLEALKSTWISDGKFIGQFEAQLSQILDGSGVVTTNNGTSSLMLAYLSLGLGPGDEIIIPGFTFAAPANMALAIGATPIYADVDADTWLLSPASVMEKITAKTKAIVPVHLYGNICDMTALTQIAKKNNLYIVEDVAEAAFSKYNNRQAGTLGDIGSFSFQATKTITMGEGGAICTHKESVRDMARLIRNHGMRPSKRYWHEVIGHNFRLTNLQAALGCAQLEFLDEIILNKKRVYEKYRSNLSGYNGIALQKITEDCEPVMWAVAIKINGDALGVQRDQLIIEMQKNNIETRPGFYAFSDIPLYGAAPLKNAVNISRNIISLPSYTMISNDEIDKTCTTFIGLVDQCRSL